MQLVRAFNAGCNVVAIEKNHKKYAMTCAWATMLDYDKVGLLIGSQSETGKVLEVGDICGISALSHKQRDIANLIGEHHSSEFDKFKSIVPVSFKRQNPCYVYKVFNVFADV